MRFSLFASAAAVALSLGGCALIDPEAWSDSKRMTVGAGVPVPVASETKAVGTSRADAADDPEIWADPSDPSRAVIFGTDKQAGLYVYDLNGEPRQFLPDGRLNNVDLRAGFLTGKGERVLVAASDRDRLGVAFYLFDPATLQTERFGFTKTDLTEPYGICVGRRGDAFLVIVNGTDGQVRQLRVSAGPAGEAVAVEERRFSVPTQPEGCVVDDATGRLYLGEEGAGVWRFDTGSTVTPGTLIAAAPSEALKPDVEGLTLLREGAKTWLIASSQGDSAFAVWRVDGAEPVYAGRFSPVAANGVDAVTGTDGVAALGGPVGPFPEGVVVMQDDVDTEGEAVSTRRVRQNYKLVDWREVKRALGLK